MIASKTMMTFCKLLVAAGLGGAYSTAYSTGPTPCKPAFVSPIDGGAVATTPAAAPALSELWDLTDSLGPKVAAFNARHPAGPIRLLAKAEFLNPASQSHKDRIARAIIREAIKRGDLTTKSGGKKTILAASSGNTGTAMANIGTQMGYDVTIITNKLCSKEKCDKIIAGGAKLWMSEDLEDQFPDILAGVKCYMDQERVLCEHYPDQYFCVNQYENMDNMMAHYETTAQEIWDQSERQATHFVMAASTGGTIMGVGKFLKERNRDIRVVLSDPHKSSLAGILEKARGNTARGDDILARVKQQTKDEGGVQVEGAGKQALTKIMEMDGDVLKYVDEAMTIHDFAAFDACREVERERGFRIGGSAGLNLCACRRLAERAVDEDGDGAVLVTLLCDDGNKYASKIFNDAWMAANDPRTKRN